MHSNMPEVRVCLCCTGFFGKLGNAEKIVNFKHKRQKADFHSGFPGVQELNVWAVFSFSEFLGRRLGMPLASLF